jgi:hypothetical protein
MKTLAFIPSLLLMLLVSSVAVTATTNGENAPAPFEVTAETLAAAHTAVATVTSTASLPVVRFFNADTIVVVSPANCPLTSTDKEDLEKVVFWDTRHSRPAYVYKSENELTRKDKKHHVLFIGCLNQFERRENFNIPISPAGKGFRIDNRQFDQPSDAFFYINPGANRMYLCKNTPDARHSFFEVGGTPFPLHVFSNNRLVLSGYNQ